MLDVRTVSHLVRKDDTTSQGRNETSWGPNLVRPSADVHYMPKYLMDREKAMDKQGWHTMC